MLSTMLLLATTLIPQAQATEVGTTARFGIGVQAGHAASVTAKFWLNEKTGLAIHAGNRQALAAGPTGGVAAEMRFHDVPAAVFVEAGGGMLVAGEDEGVLAAIGGLGGRWYF